MNYPDAKQLLGEPIDAQGASMMRFMDTYIEDNVAKVLRKKGIINKTVMQTS